MDPVFILSFIFLFWLVAAVGLIIYKLRKQRVACAKASMDYEKSLADLVYMNPNVTEACIIGTEYTHTLKRYKLVTITNKTKNSIEFKDSKGFNSWISFEEFDFAKDIIGAEEWEKKTKRLAILN